MRRYFLVITALFIFAAYFANAQCNHSMQFSTSDAAPMGADGKADMSKAISGSKIFPEYYYEIQYSQARLKYKITEFKYNQEKIYLHTWCMGQTWEQTSPDLMSQMSRTLAFKPIPGNQISFFRQMWWYDEATRKLDPSKFYAGHNIGYSVELIDARSHHRLDLLDTIGFSRQQPTGNTAIYASHPVMDIVSYTIPKTISTDSAYLRLNISIDGGIENYKLYRYDTRSIDIAQRDMNERGWIEYASAVEKFNSFHNLSPILTADKQQILDLPKESVANTEIRISINNSQLSDNALLRIVNSSTGELVFSQRIYSNGISAFLRRAGVYIVSVEQNEIVLESHKILINE